MGFGLGTTLRDYHAEIVTGKSPGKTVHIQRGHITSFDSGDGFVDVAEMGSLTYLTVARTMNVVSTSANDTAAGSGARIFRLIGVDINYDALVEDVTLNGTTPVLTAGAFLRVNTMVVLDPAGASGWNEGVITAKDSNAASTQCQMGAMESLSQISNYTVPNGKQALMSGVELNAAKAGGGQSPEIEFEGRARASGTGSWLLLFDKKMDTSVGDELDVIPHFPAFMPAKTDVRMRADTDQDATECRTRMYFILEDV